MRALRPMPADFVEVALKLERSTGRIQGYYSAGQATVARWMDEAGLTISTGVRPVPADFAQVAPTMVLSKLAAHYKTGQKAVKRWVMETGIQALPHSNPAKFKSAPAGFAELAPTMFKSELAQHYRSSFKTVCRWLSETGVQSKQLPPSQPKTQKAARSMANILPRQIVPTRVYTLYDEAADTLRRERFPVYRCDKMGRFDPKGKLWRVGRSVHTGDQLLERAARYRRAA